MPEPTLLYMFAALIVAGLITFLLRGVPFVILEPLRKSVAVRAMAVWMPAGILVILALSTFRGTVADYQGGFVHALIASAVTVAVHLLGGRRTLLSVGAGTLAFVLLVNFF